MDFTFRRFWILHCSDTLQIRRNKDSIKTCQVKVRKSYDDLQCLFPAGRISTVSVRHGYHGQSSGKAGRRPAAKDPEQADRQPDQGLFSGSRRHRRNPEFQRDHSHGGRFCQQRHYGAASGNRHHHGQQRGHHSHQLDPEFVRSAGRQSDHSDAEAHILQSPACIYRHFAVYV